MSPPSLTSLNAEGTADWARAYRQALNHHSVVSITDRNGVLVYVNDLFVALSGYERDELIGSTHAIIKSEHHDRAFFKHLWDSLGAGKSWTGEICNRTREGETFWVAANIVAVRDDAGRIDGYVSVCQDITNRKREQAALARSESFLQHVASVSGVGGWSLDLERGELYWSKHTKLIHEVDLDYEPSLATAIDFYTPDAQQAITHAVEHAIDTGEGWDLELPLVTAKGTSIWVRAVGEALRQNGRTKRLVGAFQNITQRKLTEELLREEVTSRHSAEQLLRDVLDTIPDAVAAYDEDDRLIICNSSYLETYAASAEAIKPGATFESILRFGLSRGQYAGVGSSPAEQEAWLAQRLDAHRMPPDQLVQRLRDGTWLQVREHRSESGATVGVRTDVTEIKRAESELRRFAEEDRLTGLLNRSRFTADLNGMLSEPPEGAEERVSCVALFDVDFFKPINDAYGHDIGDEVLIEIARRVRRQLKECDFAARLGGDEFVFVLRNRADYRACEEHFDALLSAMAEPIKTSGPSLTVSLSLGAALVDSHDQTSRELLKQADHAQYQAKAAGRARWRWFGDADRREIEDAALAAHALKAAIRQDDGLGISLLPLEAIEDRLTLGFSAEMHWDYAGQSYETADLRALAARSNLSSGFDKRMLDNVAAQIGGLHARGVDCGLIWLTLSAEELRLGELASKLLASCNEHSIGVDRLVMAVDEAALLERSSSAVKSTLAEVRAAGVKVAIDRFGTAGAPVGLLPALELDYVRMDWQALKNGAGGHSEALAKALVSSASLLDVTVFASNIQTPSDRALAEELGVAGVQGSVVGPPLVGEAVTDYLCSNAARQLAAMSARMQARAGQAPGGLHAYDSSAQALSDRNGGRAVG